ncbi:hypothetical protein RhiirA5_431941 [Rhizophagus irregularis]|uniref:Uncharacterized protein n=1 Tax=Rhizophagus irregularis TaxID=588596 RepID=A0A2N0NU38_9GLOM|nr:hypothetical protein RhiirA5_431941 [Rhizophagus irregularis]
MFIAIPIEEFMRSLIVGILLWGVTAESFLTGKYTRKSAVVALNWVQQNCSTIGARAAAQLEENLKSLEFKMSPEQMKQLDEVSKPTEIPFPYSKKVNVNELPRLSLVKFIVLWILENKKPG